MSGRVTLPRAPSGYSQRDQDIMRSLIESALMFLSTPSVGAGGGTSLPAGTQHDTLRYDGTNWVASSFLQNTTTAVTIGTDPGGAETVRVNGSILGFGSGSRFVFSGSDGSFTNVQFQRYANSGGQTISFVMAGGTAGAPLQTPSSSNQFLNFQVRDDTGVTRSASVIGSVNTAAPTSTSAPARLFFETTPSGSVTRLRRMDIDPDGTVVIGTGGASTGGRAVVNGNYTQTGAAVLAALSVGLVSTLSASATKNAVAAVSGTLTAAAASQELIGQSIALSPVTGGFGGVIGVGLDIAAMSGAAAHYALRAKNTLLNQLGTITADQQWHTFEATWNNSGVLFVGNFTNLTLGSTTSFASGSRPFEYRIDGVSRYYMQLANPFGDASSLGFIQITAPNNQRALGVGGSRTGIQGGESLVAFVPTLNTSSNPILFLFNTVNAGGAGASTQMFSWQKDGSTIFGQDWTTGHMGLNAGPSSDAVVRLLGGGSVAEEGLQVNPSLSNNGTLSHWVLNVLGAGQDGTYTTPLVRSVQVGTYAKAAGQTITEWRGIHVLAGPTAGTKWSAWFEESVRIVGNLIVDGTISGFSGLGAHTHAETDITDGSLLARVGSTETITGAWTWNEVLTITPDVGGKALVVTGVTQTTNQPLLDLAQTWNAGGVTFEGFRLNITNTASASTSKLFHLLFNSTTLLYVDRTGVMSVPTLLVGGSGLAATFFNSEVGFSPDDAVDAITITPAVGGSAVSVDGVSQTTNQPVLDLAQTWNAGGVSFQGIKLSVTNTASAAGARLVDLLVGGSSKAAWDVDGKFYVQGTKVVETRKTGYTAMTGTADRGTAYATSTITLQQLAERVKALQDDLTTHGLIGA